MVVTDRRHDRGRAGRSIGQALRRCRGGARRRPQGRGRRGVRIPRAQRRRQVDDGEDAHDAAHDHLRHRARGRLDVAREPDAVRHSIGVALQEAGLDPRQTGRELLVLQARLFGLSTREAAVARRGAARARRARGRRRPPASRATRAG